MPITLIVRRNDIPNVKARIADKNVDAVRDNAHFMRDYAQSIAPVRTGAFRASLYVNFQGEQTESDYGQAAARALQLNPRARIVPEQQAALLDQNVNRFRNPLGQFTQPEAVVSSAVEYALYLEEGTVHNSPRPTLRQAALATEPRFKTDMGKVAD